MSRLKTSENLFLEVNELKKLVKFLEDDGYKRLVKSLVESYGIVQNEANTNFKVTRKEGESNVVSINPGLAFDSNLDAIVMESSLELNMNNTGNKHWLVLSRAVSNSESGSVFINSDGTLMGVGTEFTSILRGQPNFPTKVKFNSISNSDEYEVVRVISDTSAIISGELTSESDVKFSVVGTFTPGFQPLDENKQIYEYDSYSIAVVDSVDEPTTTSNQFILASVEFNTSGVMLVSDKRMNHMFNDSSIKGEIITNVYENPLTSLLSVNTVGGINSVNTISADFELILEHGYTIGEHELDVTSSDNIINILSGDCNFLGSGDIPDGLFKGWVILNRKNMLSAKISNNVNKSIHIPTLDSALIEETGNDLIVIPDFNEIEYQVQVSSNIDKPSIPFYFRRSACNVKTRMNFCSYLPSVSEGFTDVIEIEIKYRMIDDLQRHSFKKLSIAQFVNIKGITETLSNSTFNINLSDIEPKEKQKNYS